MSLSKSLILALLGAMIYPFGLPGRAEPVYGQDRLQGQGKGAFFRGKYPNLLAGAGCIYTPAS